MSDIPTCPKCDSEYAYEDQAFLVCPDCGYEWIPGEETVAASDNGLMVLDANGNALADGDAVTVVKGLKVKGAQTDLKVGTKVKSIRLCEGDHNIDCRIPGFGAMKLKSEFVKKA